MAGKVLYIESLLEPDDLACRIANKHQEWETFRNVRVKDWQEVLEYVFANDTTSTTNSKLPWSNKTTIPKLCQIRDNLHSNYMAAMFPKQKWLSWKGMSEDDNSKEKQETIEDYMGWVVDRNRYYDTISRLVYDYIDYGNAFVMPMWIDDTNIVTAEDGSMREQVGYVGPAALRISPLDIVFNPTVNTFEETPKIIRSLTSLGEVKALLQQTSHDEGELQQAHELYEYLREIRMQTQNAINKNQSTRVKDRIYEISGFSSFSDYLLSGSIEILTFYGDWYDEETDTLYKNRVIKIADRHKIIYNEPNMSSLGTPPIYHVGWRLRPDSLWAAGPLENLVGMQYRIDHLENMKADCFDLIAYPPLKIKGYVEDFDWAPMERIYIGDDGDVQMISPNVEALKADTQIAILEQKMEEMAGSPKEAMGFRTPGEKTKYEVQSMENAASRVFQNKISYFELMLVENNLNAMLDLSRRNMTETTIRVFDEEYKIDVFKNLSKHDITGNGRIRPTAARHFAEQANLIQNITAFFGSAVGSDPSIRQHFSSLKLAQLFESMLEVEEFNLVSPYIALTEQADAQRLANVQEEQVVLESNTSSGLNGDFDREILQQDPTEG
jgi:hypothetical protein